uniref:Pentapeptide repeat-containing protein n=1 Tax=viral metagenome TaxID=1070528 RepID=A0A6C0C9B8_9ZZZZ
MCYLAWRFESANIRLFNVTGKKLPGDLNGANIRSFNVTGEKIAARFECINIRSFNVTGKELPGGLNASILDHSMLLARNCREI